MIGLLIELAASWTLLWFIRKEHLTVLGVLPTKTRSIQLLLGAAVAAFVCIAYAALVITLSGSEVEVNKNFTITALLKSGWWVLNSVLFEELIFRGVLLYIAIQYIGENKACLLSAASFGVYHWFSFGALGNPVAMIYVFIMTGVWGYMFAKAFAKTNSMYLPIGLHFGWNFVDIIVLSKGPLQDQLLVITTEQPLTGIISLAVTLLQLFALPFLIFFYLRRKKSNT